MTGTTENDSVTESLVMQETRKLSTLKVSKGIFSLTVSMSSTFLTLSFVYADHLSLLLY